MTMRIPSLFGMTFLLIIASLGIAFAKQEKIEGAWVGGFQGDHHWVAMAVAFPRADSGDIKPTFYSLSVGGAREIPSSAYRLQASHVHFELVLEKRYVFEGQRNSDTILGEVQLTGGKPRPFHLLMFTVVEPEILAHHAGEYEMEPGHFIWVGVSGNSLRYEGQTSGRFGLLVPESADKMFGGPAQLILYPKTILVRFIKNARGETTGLSWQEKGSPEKSARRIHRYREEAVHFQNRDVTLSGTLRMPLAKGSHPAVVFLHGSDAADRNAFGSLPAFFALHGIATLAYDKRGVGSSTGQYFNANFTDLAGDARSALHFLRSREGINKSRVGLWGISQGGLYIAPLVAVRSKKDVAFIISVSGACLTPADQKIFTDQFRLRAAGYPAALDQVSMLHRHLNDYYRTGQKRAELEAMLQKAQQEKWYTLTLLPKEVGLEIPPTEAVSRTWWRQNMDYDPATTLTILHVPMLALFGGLDELVPVRESASRLEEAMKKAGNKDYTVKIFPRGNHYGLAEAETGFMEENPLLKRYVPGYLNLMLNWLMQHTGMKD